MFYSYLQDFLFTSPPISERCFFLYYYMDNKNNNNIGEEIHEEVQNLFLELICSSPCVNDFFDCDLRIASREELTTTKINNQTEEYQWDKD